MSSSTRNSTANNHSNLIDLLSQNDNYLIKLSNCQIVRGGALQSEDLWIKGNQIINPESVFYDQKVLPDVIVNCQGNIIAPGFIDLQINGGYGYDFSNDAINTKEAVNCVARGIVKSGVTSFCPTLVTQSIDSYRKTIPKIKRRPGDAKNGANVLGIHLEGPFINPKKKGAHPEQHIHGDVIKSFDELIKVYGSFDNVAIVTLAPELDSCSVISELTSRGIVVSMGHSLATMSQGAVGLKNGANFITHLFNAMLPFHHRDPGLVGLLAAKSTFEYPIYFGIIADGIHTHDAALRIAYRTNPHGLVLVTDAISALGLEPGKKHKLGDQFVEICDNKALVAGTQTLCGSIATMEQCVRTFRDVVNCCLVSAIECATLHPARVLGIDNKKGTLNFGTDADFIILDNNLTVLATFIAGKIVWKSDKFNLICTKGNPGN